MKYVLLLAAVAATVAGPAFAAEGCSTAPQSQWQPESSLQSRLESEGLTVVRIKSENGCYEVYATDKSGGRVNLAYNAETLQKVDNPEAGER